MDINTLLLCGTVCFVAASLMWWVCALCIPCVLQMNHTLGFNGESNIHTADTARVQMDLVDMADLGNPHEATDSFNAAQHQNE